MRTTLVRIAHPTEWSRRDSNLHCSASETEASAKLGYWTVFRYCGRGSPMSLHCTEQDSNPHFSA